MHQVSFSLFAQRQQQADCAPSAIQTVEVKAVAAPALSGSGACTQLPYGGVFVPMRAVSVFDLHDGWRGEWFGDWQSEGLLDAPEFLPAGGHHSLECGREAVADGFSMVVRGHA
ncbi:hypothetical protein [Acidovorax cavernicola]|uniref:Uncharacterized protein n=1 Tax=Acidovorax cavernicola TaxID=1675792 RepID=A0A9X8D4E7_9BURK|nr:hypothetical protein [Acidovorax cavernicola]RIX79340.1 hypothetical protein D3H34_14655 [Acidovorax cavernicola]